MQFFCQDTLQFLRRKSQTELASMGDGDTACLLTDNNGHCVALLGYTHGSPMTQAQFFRNIEIMTDWQNTTCCLDSFSRDDHCSIV